MKTFKLEMDDGRVMSGELYENIAPVTVANFEWLANSGFYDGLIFHRVIPGFVIQGGCPYGNGEGGSGKRIKGEFTMNGFQNDLKHERGVLSMARREEFDTAESQFFIMMETTERIDGKFAAFGKVTEGMEVADQIAIVDRDSADKPLADQVIKSIRVKG